MYVGPVNSTAVHKFDENGNRRAFDQHSIKLGKEYIRPDIDVWEEGTLKVYCPSVLLAFPPGPELKRLNSILLKAEPLLLNDIPLIEAVSGTSQKEDKDFFVKALQDYVRENQGTSDLAKRALSVNFQAYDRSISLQKMFAQENKDLELDNLDIRTQAVYSIARQKAIFEAMAFHYAAEATFDDQFTDFPYHLPDHIQKTISENGPVNCLPEFDRRAYERGLSNSVLGAPIPDAYRFDPIIASLVAPFVLNEDGTFKSFSGWEDFNDRVVRKIDDSSTRQALTFFAKGMNVPEEFAYFAAYKMCQKEVRKRGMNRLYTVDEAKKRAERVALDFFENRKYFEARDPYLRLYYYEEYPLKDQNGKRLSKKRFSLYRQAIIDRTAIEYVNSVIGTYKFVPWEKDDSNFEGNYLPYAVMKSEKARIIRVLCSEEFGPYWRNKGLWFKKALPELMASDPSMYSKWFIPLLEKGLIDETVIQEANSLSQIYLKRLLDGESKTKNKTFSVK